MNLSKTIIVNAGLATVLSLAGLTGCGTDGSTPRDFFPPIDDTRASREFINAQADKGAAEDANLGAAHFDGTKLNSLGTEKLTRMLPSDMTGSMKVCLDLPEGEQTNSRRDAVIAYLKNCGLAESNITLSIGENKDLTHPAAEQLTRLNKTETGGTATSSDAASTSGGSSGAAASGGMQMQQ